jgi:NAD(P)-dependent dehydrogenase (short-subunit alcohol dehydrogenase family)
MSGAPKNKVVLITGCSSGFGLLIASRLASKNFIVYATMRNLDKQSPLLSEVNLRGGNINILKLDVTNKENVKEAISKIAAKEGYIDIVINNAGYGIGGFFEDLSDKEIRDQIETNFFGVQNVIREVIPLMRQRSHGKIINLSSVAGFSANPCFGAYNASKWALEGFSESLRYELKPWNWCLLGSTRYV